MKDLRFHTHIHYTYKRTYTHTCIEGHKHEMYFQCKLTIRHHKHIPTLLTCVSWGTLLKSTFITSNKIGIKGMELYSNSLLEIFYQGSNTSIKSQTKEVTTIYKIGHCQ